MKKETKVIILKEYLIYLNLFKGVNAQGATTRACVRACARVASNYPFAKLMEIAECAHRTRACDKRQKRQATKF